jgi:hypothetical protein
MRGGVFSACVAAVAFGLVGLAEAGSIYVSPKGSDDNPGTSIDAPMRTIQKAVDAAKPGDTVLVRGGTYRETVTTSRSGTAKAPSQSGITRTRRGRQRHDPVAGEWTPVENEVFRAPMSWSYHFENEKRGIRLEPGLPHGKMLELARWPDQTSPDPVRPTIAIAESVTFSKSDPSMEKNDLATFHKSDFNEDPARWVGAKIWVNLARNDTDGQGQTGVVVSATAGSVTAKGIDTRGGNGAWSIGEGTEFYLFQPTVDALKASGGIAAALGRGEWFIDAAEGQIYVRTATGEAPATDAVEAKRRTYGFNLDGDGYITLQGINLFGTALTTDDLAANRNVSPAGCRGQQHPHRRMNAQYVSHFTDQTGNYQMQWQQKSGLILSGTRSRSRTATSATAPARA